MQLKREREKERERERKGQRGRKEEVKICYCRSSLFFLSLLFFFIVLARFSRVPFSAHPALRATALCGIWPPPRRTLRTSARSFGCKTARSAVLVARAQLSEAELDKARREGGLQTGAFCRQRGRGREGEGGEENEERQLDSASPSLSFVVSFSSAVRRTFCPEGEGPHTLSHSASSDIVPALESGRRRGEEPEPKWRREAGSGSDSVDHRQWRRRREGRDKSLGEAHGEAGSRERERRK